MTKMPEGTKLQPGDVVVTGATAAKPHGDSFVVTEDMKAASWQFKSIPDLSKEPDVRIFRHTPTTDL
jgi:hypothetical protein